MLLFVSMFCRLSYKSFTSDLDDDELIIYKTWQYIHKWLSNILTIYKSDLSYL